MPAPNYNLVESQKLDLPILLKEEDCKARTFIVTGANTGIGYESAKRLVELGSARVIITVRDAKKGDEAREKIETLTGRKGVIQVRELDLTRYDSVRAFAKGIKAEVDRVDGVLANAGTSNGTWEEAEGYEASFTVNLFSNLLLLALLAPHLKEVGRRFGTTPRFTFVGSIGPFVAPTSPLANLTKQHLFKHLNDQSKHQGPDMSPRYTLSKLFLLMATRQLAKQAPVSQSGIIVNVAEPGMCKTGLTKNLLWITRVITWISLKLFGRTAEMGSRAVLAGLALGEDSHGSFVSDCKIHNDRIPDWLTNEDGQEWERVAWQEVSDKLQQIEPGCLDWVSVAGG